MISVVVPNYNGAALFRRLFAANYAFFKTHCPDVQWIIVDDASNDDSVAYLRTHFPAVEVLENRANLGFGPTVNRGVAVARHPLLFLLNTDMQIAEGDLSFVLQAFADDPTLFSLTPRILIQKKQNRFLNESLTTGRFRWGRFEAISDAKHIRAREGMSVLWGCGGATFVSTEKFRRLGGFDSLFAPFYYEDVDLGYRALKRGWQNRYTQTLTLHHLHSVTISRFFSREEVQNIFHRNRWFFLLKNITDPTAVRAIHRRMRFHQWYPFSRERPFIAEALKHADDIRRAHQDEITAATLTDAAVLEALHRSQLDSQSPKYTDGVHSFTPRK